MQSKSDIRKAILERRTRIAHGEKKRSEKRIIENIRSLPEYQKAKTIALYFPVRGEVDLLARTKAMAEMHKTYAVTGGICISTAAMIDGTVVSEVCAAEAKRKGEVRIGHPSGVLEVFVSVKNSAEQGWTLLQAGVCRTARPIMDGEVYVSRTAFPQ